MKTILLLRCKSREHSCLLLSTESTRLKSVAVPLYRAPWCKKNLSQRMSSLIWRKASEPALAWRREPGLGKREDTDDQTLSEIGLDFVN